MGRRSAPIIPLEDPHEVGVLGFNVLACNDASIFYYYYLLTRYVIQRPSVYVTTLINIKLIEVPNTIT